MAEVPVYIRTASARDLPAVRELLVATWHATYDSLYGAERVEDITGRWHSVEALGRNLARTDSEFVLADDGEALLGMAFAFAHGDHADLKQLYVHPSAQGRGVGALLLAEIENSFDEAHALMLEVEEQNTAAISFYKRMGFVEQARSDTCNGEAGFGTILMSKAL